MTVRKLGIFILLGVFAVPGIASAVTRSLTVGHSGADVREVQSALIEKGYLQASATGYFGPATVAAVKKFQCDKKIVCSGSAYGTVGPKTLAALTGSAPASTLEVGGWIPYWRSATGTQDVLPRLNLMTHISPFVLTMKKDGTLNDAGNLPEEPWVSFVAAARAQKVRVIPTVMWGDGETIHAILSDTKKRIALEDEIAAFVKDGGYDGIDIDFEAKLAETKEYFSLFLKGLDQRLGKNKWLYCTIEARMPLVNRYGYDTTPPPEATQYANDYVAINKYCDRVIIMAYDQGAIDVLLNASRAAPYVPVADPAWVENVVTLAAKTISKQKLMIGIPTYGYEYSVTPLGQGYRYDRQWAFNPGYGVQLAKQLGIAPVRNSAGELSFIYKSNDSTKAAIALASIPGAVSSTPVANMVAPPDAVYSQKSIAGTIQPPFNIVWWSDAQAVQDKVELAKRLGVRGIAVFKFDGGEDSGIWQVLPQGVKRVSP